MAVNFNTIQNQPQQVGFYPQNTGGYYSYAVPQESNDTFSNSDMETTKNAGIVLVAGMMIREALKKWTNNMFTSFFSKNSDIDPQQLTDIGVKMLQDKGLMAGPEKTSYQNGQVYTDKLKKLNLIIEDNTQNAHFDYANKEIRVSKNTLLSLPHEIGHAVQEHSTKVLKFLQRSRGKYTTLALLLYGLGRSKSADKKGKETFFGKIQNTLYKYNVLIPLIAFSPELITEFAASKIGIDYLKQAKVPTNIIKAAKKHYAVAFCTYLALPAFAMFDNLLFSKAMKN